MSDTEPTPGEASDKTRTAGYRVLARKYRPKDFTDLMVGQEPMVRTLTNAFETGRIAQAYMLTGVRGVGKTTTARILARGLNYKTAEIDRPTIDLRIPGEHCEAIMEGRHVDVIEMDAASHTGIDDIREIIEQVRYRPVSARFKVYIIDEVHMLSTAAFNGLLKTLEEPPEHVKFIFATTEIRKVPITVLSRCQRFDLRRISAADLVHLFTVIAGKEGITADAEALSMIARAAEGSARDGLSLLDQAIAHGNGTVEADTVRGMLGLADRGRIVDLFEHVAKGDARAALDEFASQYEAGASPAVVLTDLADFTHLVTRLRFVPEAGNDPSLSEVERRRGAEFAGKLPVTTLSRLWQMLLKGISETETASRPAATAEMVLIRLAHAAFLPSPEEAARRLQSLESGESSARPASPSAPSSAPQARDEAGPLSARSTSNTPREMQGGPAPVAKLQSMAGGLASPLAVGKTEAAPQPAAPAAAPAVKANNIDDIVELCAINRDVKLKAMVRNFIRPVRIEPGRLDAALQPGAPATLLNELAVKLKDWTGIHWIVSFSREAGDPTMVEAEASHREARLTDARADPDIVAIMSRFPGSKVTDVRIRVLEGDLAEDGEHQPPATLESEEGDILPGDDIEF